MRPSSTPMNPSRLASLAVFTALLASASLPAQINTAQTLAPSIYFHEGDPRQGHSNGGWVVLDDYVLVIDANYPSGAKIVLPKIKESTDKPIKLVFDTHQHADHAYGNQIYVDAGAVPIAHVGALEGMKKAETGYYGGSPGAWENSAKKRPDVAASKLKPPSLLFPKDMFIDDGHHRVELRYFGVAHTHGDAMAWLPKEKILFTGDTCVNSASNNLNDGDTAEWIRTLDAVKALGAERICPGHGPMGGPEIIVDQQRYLIELRKAVQALVEAKKSPAEVKAALPGVAAGLKKIPNIARYVPDNLTAHVQKVYREMGGETLP